MVDTRYEQIGARIREAISGICTQNELARGIGYKPATISNWISGKRAISIEDLEKVSQFTAKPLGFFLEPFAEGEQELVDGSRNTTRPVEVCRHCGNNDIEPDDIYCIRCTFPVVNICLNPKDYHRNRPSADYCSVCGFRTFWSLPDEERGKHLPARRVESSTDKTRVE